MADAPKDDKTDQYEEFNYEQDKFMNSGHSGMQIKSCILLFVQNL